MIEGKEDRQAYAAGRCQIVAGVTRALDRYDQGVALEDGDRESLAQGVQFFARVQEYQESVKAGEGMSDDLVATDWGVVRRVTDAALVRLGSLTSVPTYRDCLARLGQGELQPRDIEIYPEVRAVLGSLSRQFAISAKRR